MGDRCLGGLLGGVRGWHAAANCDLRATSQWYVFTLHTCAGAILLTPFRCCGVATEGSTPAVVPNDKCVRPGSPEPTSIRRCFERPCGDFGWRVGVWSRCSASCGGGTRSRPVDCLDAAGTVVSGSSCPQVCCTSSSCVSLGCLHRCCCSPVGTGCV